jgi:hypothetical protein
VIISHQTTFAQGLFLANKHTTPLLFFVKTSQCSETLTLDDANHGNKNHMTFSYKK